jgi:hypothetical protein
MDEDGMFNPEHTWDVSNDEASTSESAAIWAGGKVIALVVYSSDSFYPGSHPSVDANARLIAAAPELLDVLKSAVQCLNEYKHTGYMTGWDKSLSDARLIIAKATGENNG